MIKTPRSRSGTRFFHAKEAVSQTPFSFFLQKEKGFGCPKEKSPIALWYILLYPACEICIDFPQAPLPLMQSISNCRAATYSPVAGASLFQLRRRRKTEYVSTRSAEAAAKHNAQTIQVLRAVRLFFIPNVPPKRLFFWSTRTVFFWRCQKKMGLAYHFEISEKTVSQTASAACRHLRCTIPTTRRSAESYYLRNL